MVMFNLGFIFLKCSIKSFYDFIGRDVVAFLPNSFWGKITHFNKNKEEFKDCVEKGCEFKKIKITKDDFEVIPVYL